MLAGTCQHACSCGTPLHVFVQTCSAASGLQCFHSMISAGINIDKLHLRLPLVPCRVPTSNRRNVSDAAARPAVSHVSSPLFCRLALGSAVCLPPPSSPSAGTLAASAAPGAAAAAACWLLLASRCAVGCCCSHSLSCWGHVYPAPWGSLEVSDCLGCC